MKLPKLTFAIPFLSFFVALWLLILRVLPFDWLSGVFLIVCLLAMMSASERTIPTKKSNP